MENIKNNNRLDDYEFLAERVRVTNVDLSPILYFLFGVDDISSIRKDLMDLYCGVSEYILYRMEEHKDYPSGLSWPLSLIRQFCDALNEAEANEPTITIKRLKP